MSYVSLISLILGMISIVITIKFIENYERLNRSIKNLSKFSESVLPAEIITIQDNLDITQEQLLKLFKNNSEEITGMFKNLLKVSNNIDNIDTTINSENIDNLKNTEEKFINFPVYLNKYQRNIVQPGTNINNHKLKKKNLKFNNVKKKISQLPVNSQINYNLNPKISDSNKLFSYKKLLNKNDFYKKNKCISFYNDKKFTYYVNEPEFCLGKVVYCL